MRQDGGAALELVAGLYEAAATPELFPAFLRDAARLVGATTGYFGFDVDGRPGQTLAAHGFGTPEQRAIYHRDFKALDLWSRAARRADLDTLYIGAELVPAPEFQQSLFYNEFLKPICDGVAHIVAAYRPAGPDLTIRFGLHRTADRPDFTRDEVRPLERIAPHLGRAAHLYRRWQSWQETSPLAAALDQVHTALLVIGPGQRIVFANTAAIDLLGRGDGITQRQDRLVADDPAVADRLARGLAAALSRLETGGGPLTVPIPRRRRRHPLLAAIYPLAATTPFAPGASRTALVALIEPRLQTPPAASAAALFDLTAAELRLTELLSQGIRLEIAAEMLAISRNTARNHLAAIFTKTGVNRQGDLIALLHSLAPA